jgi:hypothetical protein
MKIFQPIVTGSLNVSGSVTADSFTGSLQGTASYAVTASYAMNGGGGGSGAGFPFTGSATITGSLVVTGSTTSTEGFTGSLFGTAATASFLLGSVTSASYAATASTSTNFIVSNTLDIDGTLTDRSTVLSTIVGSNNLYTQATGSYRSAFGKYTLYNGVNARAGEFITVWNDALPTVYTDISTTDIGNTSTITFTSTIVGSNIQIDAVAGASGWTIKMLTTFI